MDLLDVGEAYDELKALNDRHLVIEALLIVEEYLEALLCKLIPNLEDSSLLSKKHNPANLSFDQKLALALCFVEREHRDAFARFPKKLQTVRNRSAHSRAYKVDDDEFNDFFEKLDKSDQQKVETITARIYAGRQEDVRTFKKINAKDQFLLLLIWFTIQVSAEINRIVDVKVLIRE